MPLTDAKIKQAKPTEKDYKLFDGKGLFLLVKSTGAKYWKLEYRIARKEKSPLSLGVYSEVTLKEAREKCHEARKLIANDVDPREARQAQRAAQSEAAANSFEVIDTAAVPYDRFVKGIYAQFGIDRVEDIERQ